MGPGGDGGGPPQGSGGSDLCGAHPASRPPPPPGAATVPALRWLFMRPGDSGSTSGPARLACEGGGARPQVHRARSPVGPTVAPRSPWKGPDAPRDPPARGRDDRPAPGQAPFGGYAYGLGLHDGPHATLPPSAARASSASDPGPAIRGGPFAPVPVFGKPLGSPPRRVLPAALGGGGSSGGGTAAPPRTAQPPLVALIGDGIPGTAGDRLPGTPAATLPVPGRRALPAHLNVLDTPDSATPPGAFQRAQGPGWGQGQRDEGARAPIAACEGGVSPFVPSSLPPSPGACGPAMYASLELARGGEVELRIGHHTAVRAALAGVAGTSFDGTRRTWRFPLTKVDEVEAALAGARGVRVRLEPLAAVPRGVALAASEARDDSGRYAAIPAALERSLMPFQREGVRFALRRGGRALLGDEMGLGKTVQALAVAAAYRDEWPVLVVAPASLREAWADAVHRWLGITSDRIRVVHTTKDAQEAAKGGLGAGLAEAPAKRGSGGGKRRKRDDDFDDLDAGPRDTGGGGGGPSGWSGGSSGSGRGGGRSGGGRTGDGGSGAGGGSSAQVGPLSAYPNTDVLIVSYNFVPKMGLAEIGSWGVVIADEAHYVKDPRAQRSAAVLPLLRKARRCLLLTGTPALNKPKELFSLLSAILPEAKLRMRDFGERYCLGTRWDRYGGATNLGELHALLSCVMARRLKAQVLPQLPKKQRQQVWLSLDGAAKRELAACHAKMEAAKRAVAEAMRREAAGGGGGSGVPRFGDDGGLIMELYRRSAELKTSSVQEYVRELLESDVKFLVFAHHTVLLDSIEHECRRRRGSRFIRITGATPPVERQRLVDDFQTDPAVQVAILSIKAAGVGLTLTAASTVVFAELTWTPGEIIQAEDRAHRIGQASSVNVYFLHARGSIDDLIWSSVQQKLENVGEAIDGEGKAMDLHAGGTAQIERGQQRLGFVSTPGSAEVARSALRMVDGPPEALAAVPAADVAVATGGAAAPPAVTSARSSPLLFPRDHVLGSPPPPARGPQASNLSPATGVGPRPGGPPPPAAPKPRSNSNGAAPRQLDDYFSPSRSAAAAREAAERELADWDDGGFIDLVDS